MISVLLKLQHSLLSSTEEEIEAADAINYMLDNYMADDLLRVAQALDL